MAYQPQIIAPYQSGLKKDKKPFLFIDDAFQTLENAYVWRERVKKRDGIKLVGRLRRVLTTESAGNVTLNNGTTTFNIFTQLSLTGESNASIEKGNLTTITLDFGAPLSQTLQDTDGDGVLEGFSSPIDNAYINYATGDVTIKTSSSVASSSLTVSMAYYPGLPVMGIVQRELASINDEQTLVFDTKYVYSYNGDIFADASTTEWSGTNSDFFWHTNFRGSDAQTRLIFVTNNADPSLDANNRIRYSSDASTWTDFTPALSGDTVSNENIGPANGTSHNVFLANTDVIPGSVSIRVTESGSDTITFRDQITTYPNGDLLGSPSENTGSIDYSTGEVTLNFASSVTNAEVLADYQFEDSFLFQAKIIIPYYGRLLAFNTYEGPNAAGSNNFFNRVRFSQVGNPLERQAWVTTTFGRGGFIDAPTNEAIVSARFYKNTLIVFFERTTWELRYSGDYGIPFLWERISSDFGSESTFSTILFDDGVLAIGDKAIVTSQGHNVSRIDLDIPDEVFTFQNENEGKERIHGIRDFQKQVVYWCYGEGSREETFPNKVLVYNYRNQTWAKFRDNVTTFGYLSAPSGVSWDSEISWDTTTSWDADDPEGFPSIVSGNPQGFVHYYNSNRDLDVVDDVEIRFNEHDSLPILGITRSATNPLRLQIPNHNLSNGEIIYIAGLLFYDISNDTSLTTDLNDKFYNVTVVDDDNVDLSYYDFTLNQYLTASGDNLGYTPAAGTGTYMGCGVAALIQVMNIVTKDFNPYQGGGLQLKTAYLDLQTDAEPYAQVSVNTYVNANINPNLTANIDTYNPNLNISLNQVGMISGATQANPCVITSENHGLKDGREITLTNVVGMTELNGNVYAVTYIDADSFSLDVDATGFTAYISGGTWSTVDDNKFYTPGSNYAWNRHYASVFGQYVTYQITYNDELKNDKIAVTTDFQMNAMTLWSKPAGRLIQ